MSTLQWIRTAVESLHSAGRQLRNRFDSTSISRCQTPCGENAPHYSILISPVPRIFSVKLHRILFKFVLARCIIACIKIVACIHLLAVFFTVFICLYVFFSLLPVNE